MKVNEKQNVPEKKSVEERVQFNFFDRVIQKPKGGRSKSIVLRELNLLGDRSLLKS
jgi:hypothetical protein